MYCYEKTQNKLFKMVKPLDEKIEKEIDETFFHSQYLFKQKIDGNYYGYCTCCNQEYILSGSECEGFTVREPDALFYKKHNEYAYCSKCARPVQVKDAWRGRGKVLDKNYAAVFQKLRDNTIVLRTFCVRRDYSGDYKNVKTEYSEHYRIFYKPGEVYAFKRENATYFYMDEEDFFREERLAYAAFRSMRDVPVTLRYPTGCNMMGFYMGYIPADATFFNTEVVEKSKYFKYSMFNYYVDYGNEYLTYKYLNFYCKHPVLCERLVKEGFEGLLTAVLRKQIGRGLNYKADTVVEFLRCKNKQELNILKGLIDKVDAGSIGKLVNCYLELNKNSIPVTEKRIKFVDNNFYFFENINTFLAQYHIEKSITELIDYLIRQNTDLTEYKDYMGWIYKYDMPKDKKTIYPRYLKKQHDYMMEYDKQMAPKVEAEIKRKKMQNFRKNILPFLQSIYEFSNDSFIIRPFKSSKEMKREGQIQSICVGGNTYVDKYIEGRGIICCLRKIDDPNTPYCTVEITNSGQLVQARMKYNNSAPEDVKAFLDDWKKYYTKKLKQTVKKEAA